MIAAKLPALLTHLPGWNVLGARADGAGLTVEVSTDAQPSGCETCGAAADGLVRQGVRATRLVEAPIAGRRTTLVVRRRRHRCTRCLRGSPQPLPLSVAGHRMTVRCRSHILDQAGLLPLAAIAAQVGAHRDAVSRIVHDAGLAVETGRPRSRADRLTTCGFCLRAFPPGEVDLHHLRPAPAGGGYATLCRTCNRDGVMSWLVANDT